MKKKGLTLLLAAAMTLSMAACGETQTDGSGAEESSAVAENSSGEESKAADTFKVTFYDTDGTTVLSEEEVAAGATVAEYTPEKEGQVFMGWYATPSLGHEFDFSQPITADTKVFAGFLENVEDTRSFAIVGSGKSPLLAASSWGGVINEEHYMTKTDGENVYTMTVDLCEGDEFQFAINSSWEDQHGGGYLESTDADGVTYFSVSGGLSDDTKKANIKCLTDGNYTFTLSTHPGEDVYDSLTFTYNGEMLEAVGELKTTYYIKGAIVTGWQDDYDERYAFTEENGMHTLVIELDEGDEFLLTTLVTAEDGSSSVGNEYVRFTNITDEESLKYVDGTESANILTKAAGTYTFTYDPASAQLTVGFAAK